MTDYWPEIIEVTLGLISPKYLAYKLETLTEQEALAARSCTGIPRRSKTGLRIEKEPDSKYLEIEFLADEIVFYKWGAGMAPVYHSQSITSPDSIDKLLEWLRENDIELVQEKVEAICPNFQDPTVKNSGQPSTKQNQTRQEYPPGQESSTNTAASAKD